MVWYAITQSQHYLAVHEYSLHCCSYGPFKVTTVVSTVNMSWLFSCQIIRVLLRPWPLHKAGFHQSDIYCMYQVFYWLTWSNYGLTLTGIELANQNHWMYTATVILWKHTQEQHWIWWFDTQVLQMIKQCPFGFELICVESKTLRAIVISYSVYNNLGVLSCTTTENRIQHWKIVWCAVSIWGIYNIASFPGSPLKGRAWKWGYIQYLKLIFPFGEHQDIHLITYQITLVRAMDKETPQQLAMNIGIRTGDCTAHSNFIATVS